MIYDYSWHFALYNTFILNVQLEVTLFLKDFTEIRTVYY